MKPAFITAVRRFRYPLLGLLLGGFVLFSACSALPGLAALSGQATAITGTATVSLHPTPTSDFNTINSPVRKLAEWDANLTNTTDGDPKVGSPPVTQGNQIAWSPRADDLAFLLQRSSEWSVGDLAIVKGPAFKDVVDPIPDTAVYGDVTWSPDGSQIGFVALRQADSLYTVMATRPDGTGLKDLFEGKLAKTDDYSSPKSILAWPSLGLLEVEITCGVDCLQTAQLDPASGNKTLSPDVRRAKNRLGGVLTRNVLTYDQTGYPTMLNPNWSPDGKKIVYFTDQGEVWMIDVTARTRYPVDLNRNGDETKWSFDAKYVAVRTDRAVTVYGWGGCPAS